MGEHAEKSGDLKKDSVKKSNGNNSVGTTEIDVSHAPSVVLQRKLEEMALSSPQTLQMKAIQEMADNSEQAKQLAQLQKLANEYHSPAVQLQNSARESTNTTDIPEGSAENKNGMPPSLKSGIESLSGLSMDDVNVHYNSDKPAGLKAHAFAQGNDIHLAPDQEKHLPHEAWHVVQQAQGRVQPTTQLKGTAINDADNLEKEADVMGEKAAELNINHSAGATTLSVNSGTVQKQEIQEEGSEEENDYISYTDKTFKISNSDARIRDSDLNERVYTSEDEIPEGKKEGDKIIIPKDTEVSVSEVKEDQGKLYLYVEGYGWTSATNIEGGFMNETLGIKRATWDSKAADHKTVGNANAILREFKGFEYAEIKPKKLIPKGTWVIITEESDDGKFVNCNSELGDSFGWTSKGNLDMNKADPAHPDAKEVKDPDARLRKKEVNYASTGKKAPQGSYVIVKEESQNTDPKGLYLKIASVKKENDVYLEDAELGWTSASNLAGGWADYKSDNAEWEGGAYVGQTNLVEIVGTGQETEVIGQAGADKYLEMAAAASSEGITIGLNSGFRTYSEQKYLYDNQHKPGFNPANRPGTSNHQKGKAFDLNNRVDTNVNKWLEIHAWEYGFIKIYSQAKEAHHWEYRPDKIKQPEIVEKNNIKYRRTYWGTWTTAFTDTVWEEQTNE